MLKKHSNRLLSLYTVGFLTACSSPTTHFYTLEPQSTLHDIKSSVSKNKVLIGIGPLSLPALLDRKQMVNHTENNTIELAEFDLWATPLKDNVIAVLTKNMATLQPNAIVRSYPWGVYGDVDYRLILDITRFDIQFSKSVCIEASWAIMEEKKHTIVNNGQAKIERGLDDNTYQGAAQLLSQLLSQLSQKISLSFDNTTH